MASADTRTSQEKDVESATPVTDGSTVADGRDPNIVDWDGPDDPMNPQNWSNKQKTVGVTLVSLITFITFVTTPVRSCLGLTTRQTVGLFCLRA